MEAGIETLLYALKENTLAMKLFSEKLQEFTLAIKLLQDKIDKENGDQILSPEQAAMRLSISRQTIMKYLHEIGFSKRNRRIFIKVSDLMNWFDNSYKKK